MSKRRRRTPVFNKSKVKNQERVILLNVENYETRVAILEKAKLVELIIERFSDRDIVGNIYKGKVDRVIPGIGAAFINFGVEKNCFLYVSDIYSDIKFYEDLLGGTEDENHIEDIDNHTEDEKVSKEPARIEDLLRKGQEILIQIIKEPLGTKGARATTHITLPGRFLVLMPTIRHIGISRRIEEPGERDRLRQLAKAQLPEGMGLIVRTAAEGATKEEFERDLNYLRNQWDKIQKHADTAHAPTIIHHDMGLAFRAARDLFKEEVNAFIIDQEETYDRIKDWANNISPELSSHIQLHSDPESLFDIYDVESQIDKLLHRRVWLKSGGYLYIDEAEALVAVDVNTGKFSGGQDIEETLVKTNMEAAKEIAHQIRARGLGGLLVIDFIDMKNRSNRHKIYQTFTESLKDDRERSTVLEMSEYGLIQMTRRRVRPSLLKTLTQPCPYCFGDGVILSNETVAIKILRELKKICRMTGKPKILVKVHPNIYQYLNDSMEEELHLISESHRKIISLIPDSILHFEKYNVELLDL